MKLIGLILIFIGIILIVLSLFLIGPRDRGRGIILIGPFPLIFGIGGKKFRLIMLIETILILLLIIIFLVSFVPMW